MNWWIADVASSVWIVSANMSSIDSTTVIGKYTYFGDANLSGTITSTDYFLIDNGFLNNRSGWINGDFDYSGAITSTCCEA